MAKKTMPKAKPRAVKNEKIENNSGVWGISDAPYNFGPQQFGTQLSSLGTIFKDMRWYLISNMRQPLSEAYVEIGLVQTIVDIPVDDALRGGVVIKTKQLDEDEIHKLHSVMEREEDLVVVAQAMKWNRLFGGAGILTMTEQDYKMPLQPIKKDSKLQFRAGDLWEFYFDHQNVEGDGDPIDNPDRDFYNFYSHQVHKSRVQILKGIQAPSFVRPRLRGWGVSVVESLVRSINQYLKANNLGFEVLDEFKLDIFKIKGFNSAMVQAGGAEKVYKRVQAANLQKNYQNALTMDTEDDYTQKQLSFAGIAEAMAGIRMQVASDMRMPLTKLFGISAAGFSSGEDDIENYNAMIEGTIRSKCKFDIIKMIELRCEQQFGFKPDDLTIEFKPLRVLSSEQEENVKTQKFARLQQAKTMGMMTDEEFKEACNHDNLLGIQIDTSIPALTPEPIEGATEEVKDTPAPKSKIEAPKAKNSLENSDEYDRRAYEVDGGDGQFTAGRPDAFFSMPLNGDHMMWAEALSSSKRIFGKENARFASWKYKQLGGK